MLRCNAVDLGNRRHILICFNPVTFDVSRSKIAVAVVMRECVGDDVLDFIGFANADFPLANVAEATIRCEDPGSIFPAKMLPRHRATS